MSADLADQAEFLESSNNNLLNLLNLLMKNKLRQYLCYLFRSSNSSTVRGQSSFSNRDRPRSASNRSSVWQCGQ